LAGILGFSANLPGFFPCFRHHRPLSVELESFSVNPFSYNFFWISGPLSISPPLPLIRRPEMRSPPAFPSVWIMEPFAHFGALHSRSRRCLGPCSKVMLARMPMLMSFILFCSPIPMCLSPLRPDALTMGWGFFFVLPPVVVLSRFLSSLLNLPPAASLCPIFFFSPVCKTLVFLPKIFHRVKAFVDRPSQLLFFFLLAFPLAFSPDFFMVLPFQDVAARRFSKNSLSAGTQNFATAPRVLHSVTLS